MYSSISSQPKKYEEYAFVLDFIPRGKSAVIREREGPLVQAIGEERLTLLEILASNTADFTIGERIPIGKENREKIVSVLGKLDYTELSNELQPITPRLHALELIPGIGKTFMRQIVNQREKKKFESFDDLERRVGVRDPPKLIARRIIEELSGGSRVTIFVKH